MNINYIHSSVLYNCRSHASTGLSVLGFLLMLQSLRCVESNVCGNETYSNSQLQFDLLPSPVNSYLGDVAEFRCVSRCYDIVWHINDTIVGAVRIVHTQTYTRQRSAGQESTLWITATASANNSIIKCTVRDLDTNSEILIESEGVLLKVQGLLQPPSNIQLEVFWIDHILQVRISWEAPFMLNITDQESEDSMIMYKVFVSNFDNSSHEIHNTSSTHLIYNHPLNINQSFNSCNDVDTILLFFQVSAINRVGSSNRSTPISLHNVLCSSAMVSVPSIVTSSTKVQSLKATASVYTVTKSTGGSDNFTGGKGKAWITIVASTTGAALVILIAIIVLLGVVIVAKKKFRRPTRLLAVVKNVQQSSLNLSINDAYASIQLCDMEWRNSDASPNYVIVAKELGKQRHELQNVDINQPESLYAEIS